MPRRLAGMDVSQRAPLAVANDSDHRMNLLRQAGPWRRWTGSWGPFFIPPRIAWWSRYAERIRPTRWCNGSTRDFGSLCLGSNPSRVTFLGTVRPTSVLRRKDQGPGSNRPLRSAERCEKRSDSLFSQTTSRSARCGIGCRQPRAQSYCRPGRSSLRPEI